MINEIETNCGRDFQTTLGVAQVTVDSFAGIFGQPDEGFIVIARLQPLHQHLELIQFVIFDWR